MQDRKRFLKYRETEQTAMEKYIADLERSLRYRDRPMVVDTRAWN